MSVNDKDSLAKTWYQRSMNSYNSRGVKHVWPSWETLEDKEKDFWRARALIWEDERTQELGVEPMGMQGM